MALVDLSRFSPDIRQDNRQRQVFSNEGAEVYESLARVGQGVANYGIEIVKKDRIKQHTDYQTKVATDLSESETMFDTEWAISAKAGVTRNSDGLSYLEAKNKFLKNKIEDARQNAPDAGLFDEYSNTLEKYRSASTVDAIKQNYKLGMEASDYNWKKLAEESGKQFASIESGSYNAAWQKKKLELDAAYADTSVYSISVADKNRKELEQGLANVIIDKNMNVDWKQTDIFSVVNEIMPLEVSLSADNTRTTIQFLKDYKENASPEEYKVASEAYLQLQKNNLAVAKENVKRNFALPSSQVTPEEFKSVNEKLDKKMGMLAEGDVLQLDAIEIEAEFTPAEKKAIARGDAGIWNSLTAEKQIDYMSGVLDWKARSSSSSKSDFDFQITQWKANVNDLGRGDTTFRGYNRFTEGPKRISDLIRTRPDIVQGNEVRYTNDLYESIMDKLLLDNALNPGTMAAKGWDAAALHNKALAQLQSYQIPAVDKGLASGAVGIKITSDYTIKQGEAFRKMRAYASQNPAGALMLVATDSFHKAANDILASGTFNSAAYNKMDAIAKRQMAPFLGSTYRSKLDEQLVAPLIATLKNDIDTARASGDENYDKLITKTLPKDANTFATIMERMLEKGTAEDKSVARAIIFKRQHGNSANMEMTNAVLKANTPAELKVVSELIASDEKFKEKSQLATEAVVKLVANFYDVDKGAVNPTSVAGSRNALINYVKSSMAENPALSPKEASERAFNVFFQNKVAVGTSSMRGTVLKKEGEDQSKVEKASSELLSQFKKELREGKVQLDTSSIPLTPEMVKAGVSFKTAQGLNKFTEMGYDIYLESIDDSGRNREVYPVILDKNTKAKYYIRDANKNPIRRSIP